MRWTRPDTRNKATLFLQRVGQVLLAEHHVCVEVREGYGQQEVEQPVHRVLRAKERIERIRK